MARYSIRLDIKRTNSSGAVTSGTRYLNPTTGPSFTSNLAASPSAQRELVNLYQPLITDTITGFTLVTEDDSNTAAATVAPGVVDWEDITNVKYVNTYAGDSDFTERINRSGTTASDTDIAAYMTKMEYYLQGEYSAVESHLTGTSDTTVWTA